MVAEIIIAAVAGVVALWVVGKILKAVVSFAILLALPIIIGFVLQLAEPQLVSYLPQVPYLTTLLSPAFWVAGLKLAISALSARRALIMGILSAVISEALKYSAGSLPNIL